MKIARSGFTRKHGRSPRLLGQSNWSPRYKHTMLPSESIYSFAVRKVLARLDTRAHLHWFDCREFSVHSTSVLSASHPVGSNTQTLPPKFNINTEAQVQKHFQSPDTTRGSKNPNMVSSFLWWFMWTLSNRFSSQNPTELELFIVHRLRSVHSRAGSQSTGVQSGTSLFQSIPEHTPQTSWPTKLLPSSSIEASGQQPGEQSCSGPQRRGLQLGIQMDWRVWDTNVQGRRGRWIGHGSRKIFV